MYASHVGCCLLSWTIQFSLVDMDVDPDGKDTSRVSLLENISDDAIYYAVYSAILCTTYTTTTECCAKDFCWSLRA